MKIKNLIQRRFNHWTGKLKPSDVHAYWKNPEDFGNTPEGHLETRGEDKFMAATIQKLIKRNQSILEVGCSSGKNLNALFTRGYTNLYGIEINPKAVNVIMPKMFNGLYNIADVKVGSLEDWLPKMRNNSIDLIFSLTVLMHIHPKSEFIFKEMAGVTKDYLITFEDENMKECWSHYPRNYKKIFEGFGLKQIEEINCNHIIKNHTMRIFRKTGENLNEKKLDN